MKQFSFFKPNKSIGGVIRADQIAPFVNGKVNPTNNYENDICIYTVMPPNDPIPKKSYWDMNDVAIFQEWILNHPNVGVIVLSKISHTFVSQATQRKDIIYLPQHHCNFLREKRERSEVRVVGLVGGRRSYEFSHDSLRRALKDISLEYVELIHPSHREAVVNFYKSIDIQIVFRPNRARAVSGGALSSSLKLANASSFGIPTVTFPERAYVDEFNGCFVPVMLVEDLISSVKRLKNDKILYRDLATKSSAVAEKYHVEHIAKLYQEL